MPIHRGKVLDNMAGLLKEITDDVISIPNDGYRKEWVRWMEKARVALRQYNKSDLQVGSTAVQRRRRSQGE